MPWPEPPPDTESSRPAAGALGPVFVEGAALAKRLDDPTVVVFDASYFPAGVARDPDLEHLERRVPGARRFDIRQLSDPGSPYPNMLPRRGDLAALLRESGARRGTDIVLYDSVGLYGAARALWTLRSFGVTSARILAGGLPQWLAEGRPVESGPRAGRPARSAPEGAQLELRDPVGIVDARAVSRAVAHGSAQLLDARSPHTPVGEPVRPVPGFTPVPHEKFVRDGRLVAPESIRASAAASGIRLDERSIVTCGTGVAASVVWLALASVGAPVGLYDGGFAEWAGEDRSSEARAAPDVRVTKPPVAQGF